MLSKLKNAWGGDQSSVFKVGAWAVAGGIALATTIPSSYFFPPKIDYNDEKAVAEMNKKLSEGEDKENCNCGKDKENCKAK
jgi:hypothetical protein